MNEIDQFSIVVTTDPSGVPLVTMAGELDLAVTDDAWETVKKALSPPNGLVIDVTDVSFIDSRGLNVIVQALNSLGDAPLIVRGASPRVAKLLEVSGLKDMLTLS